MRSRQSVLACYDVLATIFEHLALTESGGSETTEKSRRSCRKALAASAVVCTGLSHHALNVLWRELESVHPLLRTLPNCKCVDSELTFSGAILDASWARFHLYANRVRSIVGCPESYLLDPIHPSVWLFLAEKCKGSPLMPHLRDLTALDLRLSDTSSLVLLLSPSLRMLDLSTVLEEDDEIAPHVVRSLLETLPLTAPNLESFYCHIDISPGHDHGYIETFKQFVRLKTLSMRSDLPLDEDALQVLSAIPTLRDLSCSIDVSDSSAVTLRPHTFQDLTGLHVSGSFDDLTTFFEACQLPSLARLTLRIEDPDSADQPKDAFAAIFWHCNPALLTSFKAEVNYIFVPSWGLPSCLTEYFEPLLAFHNMKFFHISFGHELPLVDDDDLARFGAAWPQLSSFHADSYSLQPGVLPVPDATRPTLAGLVDLARRCPQLKSFSVPKLDATVFPGKETAGLPLGHGLRTLSLGEAVLPPHETPEYLESATVLGRIFPLIDLEDARSVVRSNVKEWEKFPRVVEEMRLGGGRALDVHAHAQARDLQGTVNG